jgi:hypothetical protein
VAAAAGAAAVAAGLPRNLQQALQWLQHINDTPVAELEDVWVERAQRITRSLSTHLNLHDSLGKLPAATEQELMSVFQLLCATITQLLKQAQEVATKHQQPAGPACSHAASSSNSSSSSSTDLSPAAGMVVDLLRALLPALTSCFVCLGSSIDSIVLMFKDIGGLG